MTDLEITRLCAEAMGVKLGNFQTNDDDDRVPIDSYNFYMPLHDDAQAMALVKKFEITTLPQRGKWSVVCAWMGSDLHDDLNRAICECVAKMQKAKGGA